MGDRERGSREGRFSRRLRDRRPRDEVQGEPEADEAVGGTHALEIDGADPRNVGVVAEEAEPGVGGRRRPRARSRRSRLPSSQRLPRRSAGHARTGARLGKIWASPRPGPRSCQGLPGNNDVYASHGTCHRRDVIHGRRYGCPARGRAGLEPVRGVPASRACTVGTTCRSPAVRVAHAPGPSAPTNRS